MVAYLPQQHRGLGTGYRLLGTQDVDRAEYAAHVIDVLIIGERRVFNRRDECGCNLFLILPCGQVIDKLTDVARLGFRRGALVEQRLNGKHLLAR